MKKWMVCSALVLAGCSSAPPLFTQDGRPTVQIDCAGSGDWSECDRRAQVACGSSGFDVLSRSSDSNKRSVYIACKKSPGGY